MFRKFAIIRLLYFITPRKFKNTPRNSKFRKDEKIGYCDFIGLNMLKSSNMQFYT